jgi:hypothetical protein
VAASFQRCMAPTFLNVAYGVTVHLNERDDGRIALAQAGRATLQRRLQDIQVVLLSYRCRLYLVFCIEVSKGMRSLELYSVCVSGNEPASYNWSIGTCVRVRSRRVPCGQTAFNRDPSHFGQLVSLNHIEWTEPRITREGFGCPRKQQYKSRLPEGPNAAAITALLARPDQCATP